MISIITDVVNGRPPHLLYTVLCLLLIAIVKSVNDIFSNFLNLNNLFSSFKDWPDDLHMSDEAFEKYAIKLEMEDFEDDIRNLVNIFVTF